MKNITFNQASLLIGRKGVQVLNENHEAISSWKQFFNSERYYTQEENLRLIPITV
jgi:hypothetical protein